MYEDEYYVSLLQKKNTDTNSLFSDDVLFYKYFSDLPESVYHTYEMDTTNHTFTKERANVLGVSVPNTNSWVT